ncbi:MAG: hypothetical protein IJ224_11510 [Lachnospiraceae bacterium]|nr:hypothetical protein [Lachnospiraceae bacterium]
MMTRAECLSVYGSDYYIKKKIKDGELYKISKGVYSKKRYIPELAVVAYKYNNAVVTMKSAFYIYELTDVVPDKCDLATTRDAAKISDKSVKQYFVQDDFFRDGIETVNYKGYDINIYSKERMLIELVRYKSKLPFDYYKEILLNYRKIIPQLNIQKIQDIALEAPKSNKILEILQLEVF